jgi:hypothetical protein
VFINNSQPTPKSLNAWLKASNNYECAGGDCNNLVLTAPAAPPTSASNPSTSTSTSSSTAGLAGSVFQLIGEAPKPPAAQIAAGLAAGSTVYIAHVNNRSHFVLLTGTVASSPSSTSTTTNISTATNATNSGDTTTFYVNDPYFNVSTHSYSSIADIIAYKVIPHTEPKAYARSSISAPWILPSSTKTVNMLTHETQRG